MLPGQFGPGFVYLALSWSRGDIERAVDLLLSDSLPPLLQHVDPALDLQGAAVLLTKRGAKQPAEIRGAEGASEMPGRDAELNARVLAIVDETERVKHDRCQAALIETYKRLAEEGVEFHSSEEESDSEFSDLRDSSQDSNSSKRQLELVLRTTPLFYIST
ncbi:hypothetical protein TGPRC2_306440 [Toxoplasma gondii TgCatPRC2]|uniref:Uncharacterized protein n=4 Tax=Toxoplasma gondii TaxID=5811 RepID=A0A151H4A4_TOXGO|nr:hypothetical protein TGFOU_306440 [Toxoplasma gondii FOU]KFH09554.1 hypothetical protein TGMAS_415370 [Toxoplasma gondii MAS]KYF44673.1 hypothetical protein TGARI_306440 [Toxoplasma gondii ARI]KYK64175.1 hypothetical protein TGPRC2_306440 [Toxoplasma gondii TgCatPRC2]